MNTEARPFTALFFLFIFAGCGATAFVFDFLPLLLVVGKISDPCGCKGEEITL
jgi:hypothetical protein